LEEEIGFFTVFLFENLIGLELKFIKNNYWFGKGMMSQERKVTEFMLGQR